MSAIFFLHFQITPAVPTEDVQGGYVDTCAICDSLSEAEILSRSLILAHRYVVGKLLASWQTTPDRIHELDEIELPLYLRARQRDPKCSAYFATWGKDRPESKIVSLGIPPKEGKQ